MLSQGSLRLLAPLSPGLGLGNPDVWGHEASWIFPHHGFPVFGLNRFSKPCWWQGGESQAALSVSFPASEFRERVNFLGGFGGGPSSLAGALQLKSELQGRHLVPKHRAWLFRIKHCDRV